MIQKIINQYKAEGIANSFCIYANIGNNSDELIVCEACEADACGCEVVSIDFIRHNEAMVTAVIIAEVR